MENPVIIFGTGGLGRAALEIFESNGNVVYGFLDDDKKLHNTDIDNIPVLGSTTDQGFLKLIGQKCEAFVATDDSKEKQSIAKVLIEKRKVMPTNAIHPSAYIAKSAVLGHGNFINANVTLGAGSDISNHCILHSGCTVDHDAKLGDFVQVGAGATVSAHVELGENAFVGAGAVIITGVKIGKNARVGAGSVVIADVAKGETVFGNPAVKIEQ
ncbi:acetyltransferase [Reichenbachiella carrageenanivorans]|uniref:Acetyltransferase n=1 Tax=Reichenbachiella carrageenanivorans TaxID=2979869 RepID=A0ABY6D3I1_9BACT|nr:acetyltransferase [Reichenbachiella carrageenanivorans]UXX80710.1 acetyltransferase [Reichenbachiella carrageenanivorans]